MNIPPEFKAILGEYKYEEFESIVHAIERKDFRAKWAGELSEFGFQYNLKNFITAPIDLRAEAKKKLQEAGQYQRIAEWLLSYYGQQMNGARAPAHRIRKPIAKPPQAEPEKPAPQAVPPTFPQEEATGGCAAPEKKPGPAPKVVNTHLCDDEPKARCEVCGEVRCVKGMGVHKRWCGYRKQKEATSPPNTRKQRSIDTEDGMEQVMADLAKANASGVPLDRRYKPFRSPESMPPPRKRTQPDSCAEEGCDIKPRAKGLCPKHYQRRRNTAPRQNVKADRPQSGKVPDPKDVPRAEVRETTGPRCFCGSKPYQNGSFAHTLCKTHYHQRIHSQQRANWKLLRENPIPASTREPFDEVAAFTSDPRAGLEVKTVSRTEIPPPRPIIVPNIL